MTLIPGALSKAGAVSGAVPQDTATATFGAVLHTTRSGNGVCCALARHLVAVGAPDQAWEARDQDGQRIIFGDSLHALARTTLTAAGRFTRWHPHPLAAHDVHMPVVSLVPAGEIV
jgi:hypothetical protein